MNATLITASESLIWNRTAKIQLRALFTRIHKYDHNFVA